MLWRMLSAVFVLLATPSQAQVRPVGVYGQWGAFERQQPRSCYAIASPQRSPRAGESKPFASVGYWPQRKLRGQVHFRLSREKRRGSAVLLRIGDRTFQLVAGPRDAWAPDATADGLITAAMRTGVDMILETRAANGTLVRDSYGLQGAATAIDAAAIACSR
jgi:hypothetical protein